MMLSAQHKITQEHKDRAAEVAKQMTLEEKVAYITGYENWYIREIPRLGLPFVRMADGPQGVRNNTKSTLYPSGVAAAATWDKDLINQMGIVLGKDARARGVHILLGPGANINPYSRVEYREGIFMGYRGYDKTGVQPLFPFGFGLSYTTFEYSDPGRNRVRCKLREEYRQDSRC